MLKKKTQKKPKEKTEKKPPIRHQVEVYGYVYDVVYVKRKPKPMGRHGSDESDAMP